MGMVNFMNLAERFEFRDIKLDEGEQAVQIEQICFPPHEACSREHVMDKVINASELFLVAVDKETGKVAGIVTGIATDEGTFRDEFFTDIRLYQADGQNIMLLGLDVLPEYRGQGLAREIMNRYAKREKEKGRKALILTCLESKVGMYQKMGYVDLGISVSTWGNEEWHEMRKDLQ